MEVSESEDTPESLGYGFSGWFGVALFYDIPHVG